MSASMVLIFFSSSFILLDSSPCTRTASLAFNWESFNCDCRHNKIHNNQLPGDLQHVGGHNQLLSHVAMVTFIRTAYNINIPEPSCTYEEHLLYPWTRSLSVTPFQPTLTQSS